MRIEIRTPLPNPNDRKFISTGRSKRAASDNYMQEVRRIYRAIFAIVKAKMVAVTEKISTVSEGDSRLYILTIADALDEWNTMNEPDNQSLPGEGLGMDWPEQKEPPAEFGNSLD